MRKLPGIILIATLIVLACQPVRAEGALILTDAQISGIQENCRKSKAALEQLHTADTLLRVNLGQRYENMSLRLMAPLNARIVGNNMDGVDLTKLTVQYNQAIKQFSSDYSKYDATVNQALKTDCAKDPIMYYQRIEQARSDRASVHKSADTANGLLGQYKTAFEAFTAEVGEQ